MKSSMLNGLIAVFAVLVMVGSASASFDVDGTPWDVEWDDGNDPTAQGWNATVLSGLQLNTRIGGGGVGATPGWLTAAGSAGGHVVKNPVTTNTKAAGWTAEWRMFTHAGFEQGLVTDVIAFNDDTNMIRIDYDASTDTVVLRDGMPPSAGGTSDNVSIVLHDGSSTEVVHVYRLVREAGSDTVELYIDNDFSSPAAQITLVPIALPHADAGNLNSVLWGKSLLESSWDYFRFHSGATTTIPEPASLALIGLGGLMILGRRRA